jgi:sulfonate transport system permease protein
LQFFRDKNIVNDGSLAETDGATFDITELRKRVLPYVLPVAALVAWQYATTIGGVAPQILPSPLAVGRAVVRLAHGELWSDIAISSGRAFSGFAIGGGLGLILGLLSALFKIFEEIIDTTVQMIRTVPPLALLPLIILWLGVGEPTKIVLVAMGTFFPIYLNTYHGMKQVDPALVETGKVYGLKGFRLFRQVILPGALPSILNGFRFALGAVWITLIAAEAIATESGIGYLSTIAREYMQTDVVFVSIILYALLGKGADAFARQLERILLPWHSSYAHKKA